MGAFHERYQVKFATLPASKIWPGWLMPASHIRKENSERGVFDKLEKNVTREGMNVPIIVRAGDCDISFYWHMTGLNKDGTIWGFPQEKKKIISTGNNRGNGRLYLSKRHNWTIPCLVLDYVNMFPALPEIKEISEIEFYLRKHKPFNIQFHEFDMTYEHGLDDHESYLNEEKLFEGGK